MMKLIYLMLLTCLCDTHTELRPNMKLLDQRIMVRSSIEMLKLFNNEVFIVVLIS